MIFQSDIASIDNEINQLLAQVEAARQKQAQLTELDALTDNSLTQLKTVVSKIECYDKSAIANLKNAVLGLFGTDDDSGNQEDDEPCFVDEDSLEYPTLEGQFCDIGHDLDWYWERCAKPEGQAWEFASPLYCQLWEDAPLTGQACDWASPFASPLSSILWEDAPLNGQYCTITLSTTEDNENKGTSEGEAMPYMELVRHPENSAIAYQRKHDGEIICVYVGFRTKAIAQSWLHFFEAVTSRVQLRQAKRLEEFKWEVKVQGVSIKQIERYAGDCDFSKNYRPEIGSFKPPKTEVVLPIDKVKPGQKIRTKDGLELTIMSAGCFDDKTFFAKDANEQRQLIELDDVAEFLPVESAAQTAGIEPPTGWGKPQLEQAVKDNASILEVGDVVEITGDRHPQHFGLVGTVESLSSFSELPISVRTPRGLKGYLRSDLKFISKGEKPQRQGLQAGQVLMGDRVITSGNYIGLRRSAATFNTAERIATIQLAHDLQNLGFDPRLAASVMAGELDDASDF
jgi:hypothetical protein